MDAKTLCLAVLSMGEASGYDIRRQFEQGPFRTFYALGFGSIYPALKSLALAKLITPVVAARRTGNGSSGPDRKVYRITAAGRMKLADSLAREPGRTIVRSDFVFVMFFSHLLPAAEIDRLCQSEAAYYRECVAELSAHPSAHMTVGQKFARDLGIAVHRAIADFIDERRLQLVREALLAPRGAAAEVAP
jgi:PadR family transcriptional regulator, regulatory protein AphA